MTRNDEDQLMSLVRCISCGDAGTGRWIFRVPCFHDNNFNGILVRATALSATDADASTSAWSSGKSAAIRRLGLFNDDIHRCASSV
jgi:hypothetical protein